MMQRIITGASRALYRVHTYLQPGRSLLAFLVSRLSALACPRPLPLTLFALSLGLLITNERKLTKCFQRCTTPPRPLIHGRSPRNTMWATRERQDMIYGRDTVTGDGADECRNGFLVRVCVFENVTLTKRFIEGALVFGISLLLTRISATDTRVISLGMT